MPRTPPRDLHGLGWRTAPALLMERRMRALLHRRRRTKCVLANTCLSENRHLYGSNGSLLCVQTWLGFALKGTLLPGSSGINYLVVVQERISASCRAGGKLVDAPDQLVLERGPNAVMEPPSDGRVAQPRDC